MSPIKPVAVAALLAAAGPALAQAPAPVHIPTRDGEVILATPTEELNYRTFGFAAVRRSGDTVYISGVIAGPRPGEGTDVESFKAQVRRTFRRLETLLASAGLGFDDVVMINSFHVWNGPNFSGDRETQFKAFEAVKEEFMHGPHPAWTAVGTTGLLAENGVVEVQMIAKVPPAR